MRTAVKILFLLATLFSIASCFPERYQHSNHNGHKDWQSHLLSIILNKTSTGRSSTKLPGSTPLHQGQHTTTSVSPEVTSRNSENSSVQHGYYRGDYYVYDPTVDDYQQALRAIYGIVFGSIGGIALLIGCCVFCCLRSGMCRKESRGFVVASGNPSVINQTIVQQHTAPPVQQMPVKHAPQPLQYSINQYSPPPAYEMNPTQAWGPTHYNTKTNHGIENPGYSVAH